MNDEKARVRLHEWPSVPERATRGQDSGGEHGENVRLSPGSRQVWTDRMLEALARGNEGKKWHTLNDKVWSPRTLSAAVKTVTARKGAAGVDGQTTEAFAKGEAEEVATITRLLREGRYEPRPVKRRWIEKPGSKDLRPLGIPTVRDRIVQSALLYVMEPIFELDPLDHQMAGRGREMIRYADDFVILCRTEAEAHQALAEVQAWMAAAGLTLHPEKTRIVDATLRGGFDFLGWHFERGYRWPREKSQQRYKEAIRKQTRRKDGRCLKEIIRSVNAIVRGWGNYFRGGVRNVPVDLDQWLRMRMRSILRRRAGREGRGRGLDHHRYPNKYFIQEGLTFLVSVTHPDPSAPRKT